jgi:hypothetical protein
MHLAARRSNRYVVLVLLAIAACTGSSAAASRGSSANSPARLLVKFRAGTSSAATARLLSNVGASDLRLLPTLDTRVVRVSSSRAQTTLATLERSRGVEYAERDAILEPQELLPSDPSFPQNSFAVPGGAWGWFKTRTTQAWDVTQGDPSVSVAVIDTGGLKTSGLSDWASQTVTGWNVLKNSTDTSGSGSSSNHQTYVAGVIGLAGNNGTGNAGFCPGCKIMPVQIGDGSTAYVSDVATGIIWAADHGARVENLSIATSSSSSTLTNAVSYARSKGVVLIAAAGNGNCDCPTYPAATPGVIGVGGTTTSDTKQGDSNYGQWVTLAAPEGNITGWSSLNGAPGLAPKQK